MAVNDQREGKRPNVLNFDHAAGEREPAKSGYRRCAPGIGRVVDPNTRGRTHVNNVSIDPYRPDVLAELARLVELVGVLVWCDGDENKCGIRFRDEEQKNALSSTEEGLAAHELARRIEGAGKWVEGVDDGGDSYADALELPGVAFHVAVGTTEPVRRVLGEIIAREALIDVWNDHTDPLQVFDAWADEVRPLAIRLAVVFQHKFSNFAKPWDR